MKRTLYVGRDGLDGAVFIPIELRQEDGVEGPTLAITSIIGPKSNGDSNRGGQAKPNPATMSKYAPGWDRDKLVEFLAVWERWHLNTMRAGSPKQQAWLEDHDMPEGTHDWYRWAVESLTEVGLNPDASFLPTSDMRVAPKLVGKPYFFGTAWLSETLPDEVLKYVTNLPNGGRTLPDSWRSR